MNEFHRLPNELLANVFVHLPVYENVKFQRLNRRLCSILLNEAFARQNVTLQHALNNSQFKKAKLDAFRLLTVFGCAVAEYCFSTAQRLHLARENLRVDHVFAVLACTPNMTNVALTKCQFVTTKNSLNILQALSNLEHLQFLNLERSTIGANIPSGVSALTNLSFLVLAGTQLSGSIPNELYDCINLTTLVLSHNSLSGTISGCIKNLQKLERIFLFKNKLSGAIPAELSSLPSLVECYLQNNNFSGDIPEEFFYGRNVPVNTLNICCNPKLSFSANQASILKQKI
ncbi:hypothetical protein HK100_009393, partial [Physocladia obscura]